MSSFTEILVKIWQKKGGVVFYMSFLELQLFKSMWNTAVGIKNCKQLFSLRVAFTTQKKATRAAEMMSVERVAIFWVVNASSGEKSCLQFSIPTGSGAGVSRNLKLHLNWTQAHTYVQTFHLTWVLNILPLKSRNFFFMKPSLTGLFSKKKFMKKRYGPSIKKDVNRDSHIASSPISQSSSFKGVRCLILASWQRKLRGYIKFL